MSRRLYNEYEMLTDEGVAIDQKVAVFIRQLLRDCEEDDISLRDAEHVAVNAVMGLAAEALLSRACRQRKERNREPR